jgi:hypothetical protein
LLTGIETCSPPRNSRKPETAISRTRMISPAITCASPTNGPRRIPCAVSTRITAAIMILSAIGSRNTPSFDTVPLDRGEVAVEVVGDAHQAVEREGEAIAELPAGPPQQEREQRHREDSRQRQQVGQREHRTALARRADGKKCALRLFLPTTR